MEEKQNTPNQDKNYGNPLAIAALMVFMIALSIYGENESQWFNSYVSNISSVSSSENRYFFVSLMVSASGIVGAIFFIIWGCVSDSSKSKHGRRKPLLVIGSVTTAILMVAFGLSTNYWWLLVCDGILIAITSNMFHITNRAIVPDIWEPNKRGRINTYMFIGSSLGGAFVWLFALAMLPGGSQSFTRETHQLMFLIASLTLIIAAVLVWFFVEEPPIPAHIVQQPWTVSFWNLFNIQELKKHPEFMKLFGASLLVIMANNAFKPFLLIGLQDLNFTADQILITAIIFIVTVSSVVYLLFKRLDKVGRKNVTMIGLIFCPIGCLFVGFSRGAILPAIIGLAITFPFILALEISISTWTQDLLPEDERGKFLGIINIGKAAGQAPGVLIAGAVADYYSSTLGVYVVFLVAALFLIAAIPAFMKIKETIHPQIT